MAFYVRLIWEFQSVVEKRMEEVPNQKGVRAFSLFPVSTTYTSAHIKINGTTLAGFYSRIKQRVEGYRWEVPGVLLSSVSFKLNRWTVMRNAFDITHFETRRPECRLSKTEFASLSVQEKYEHASHLFANQTEEEKTSDKKSAKSPVIPAGYVPNVVIGLDPGMRAVTTREYRHLAGFNRFRAWNETVSRVPKDHCSHALVQDSKLQDVSGTTVVLLEQRGVPAAVLRGPPVSQVEVLQKRMARVAVDAIAKRIHPAASKKTCVAYGGWSRRKGIKGHAPSPVKGLKQALQKRAMVVSMDEFRTSKLCSQCHQTLSSVRYSVNTKLPKRKKRKGVVLARNRAEIHFEEKECH
ncbi:hypothetical protein GQ600_11213 [Phytophthora cactorum]|nr:hypothetical protein GQ600_11213 [Phytophthora cactorum]